MSRASRRRARARRADASRDRELTFLLDVIVRQHQKVASLNRCLDESMRMCMELHGRRPLPGARRERHLYLVQLAA